MGGRIVLPENDNSITKVIKNFHFTPKDISDFWKIFQRMDKAKTGLVPLTKIFTKIDYERNLLTDVLLEMLEIEHDGEINFSDFLLMVTTYCFFETVDILKLCQQYSSYTIPAEVLRTQLRLYLCLFFCETRVFNNAFVLLFVDVYVSVPIYYLDVYVDEYVPIVCFYVFDQDKTGFFSVDDLNNLINAVHDVKPGSTVTGTVKSSWNKLTFKADEMEFSEFRQIHNQFPRLFQPAFRLQQMMMIHYKGESWWTKKKQKLVDVKEEADRKIEAKKKKKQKKKDNKKNKKIQRNMGFVRYYLCPCWRKFYDPTLTAYDMMTEEEKRERDRQVALARREAELKVKNPETAAWLKYQRKVANNTYVVETIDEDAEGPMDVTDGGGLDASSLMAAAMGNSPAVSTAESKTATAAGAGATGSDTGAATPRSSINSLSGPSTGAGGDGGGLGNRQSITSQTSDGASQQSGQSPRRSIEEAKHANTASTSSPSAAGTVTVAGGVSDSPVSSIGSDQRPARVKKVVVNNYLDQKLGSTERNRADRADARAERKKARQKKTGSKF